MERREAEAMAAAFARRAEIRAASAPPSALADQAALERVAGTDRPGRARDYSRARVSLPAIPHGDPGSDGLARGPVERARIEVMGINPKTRRPVAAQQVVARRAAPRLIARLPEHCRDAADIYLALLEEVGSPGGPVEGARRAGVSDGGATTRVARAERLRRADAVIGAAVVLAPRRGRGGREPITARALIDQAVVAGMGVGQILDAAGWSRRKDHAARLGHALRETLDRLAVEFGIIAAGPAARRGAR